MQVFKIEEVWNELIQGIGRGLSLSEGRMSPRFSCKVYRVGADQIKLQRKLRVRGAILRTKVLNVSNTPHEDLFRALLKNAL